MAAREGKDLRLLLVIPPLQAVLARVVVGTPAGSGPVATGDVETETGEAGLHEPP